MISSDYEYQRRFPRISSEKTLLVEKLGEEAVEEIARTRTISLGGCGFRSPEPLGNGSIVRLLIAVEQQVVKVGARVVYELESAEGGYDIGIEFLEMNSEDRKLIETVIREAPEAPSADSARGGDQVAADVDSRVEAINSSNVLQKRG